MIFVEYEKLPSAPDVEYDALQSGQIRLVWRKLTFTGHDSDLSYLSGYRVFCSDQQSFARYIPSNCLVKFVSEDNGLVRAVISGLSITRPTYSSVQIVRTINGRNVTDDLFSDAVGYCAGW
jgi:hypothetical protein